MSRQVSAVPHRSSSTVREARRPSANFHPSTWADYFRDKASNSDVMDNDHDNHSKELEIHKLKEEVRRMLAMDVESLSQKLDMVDQIQRLGIAYHFEMEINQVMKQIYEKYFVHSHGDDIGDLYTTALLFRLLRQLGYRISCDIFRKFMDHNGKFCETHLTDVRGLLSLYEASHLRIHGEDVLDEALTFTRTQLELIKDDEQHLNSPLVRQVHHALKQSIRRGLPRLEQRLYIPLYEANTSHDKALLSLAKLDFNHLQRQHWRELLDLQRWWKELDFKAKLPFARDRLVEGYFWIIGVCFEPQFALVRKILTKVIVLTSVLDDIYDAYGTYEELELFTRVVERWDIDSLYHELPEYMQVFYVALLDAYSEIGKTMADRGTSYRLYYAKEAMRNQARGYLAEATWLHQRHTPTMEEYMQIALQTCGYGLLAVTFFVGMGDIVTEHSLLWLSSNPKILKASTTICRLMDDLASHKFEQQREHIASAVGCYTNQYGVTEQEAEDELLMRIDNAWKDINEECLCPTAVPMPLLVGILNLTRVMDVLYKDIDHYTNPQIILNDYIKSVLVDPVPI